MSLFYPVKRKVIVNTKTGKAFKGILWRRAFGYVLLKNTQALKGGGEAVAVDGEVFVYKRDVDFIQVLP